MLSSTVREVGWHAVCFGRVLGESGRCSMAIAGCPEGSRMATEEALAILVLQTIELYAVIGTKAREPQAPPLELVVRYGQSYS
jgi:hypothetical protein